MNRPWLHSSRAAHRVREPRVLIVVQNLHVPADRRVWQECRALRDAGYAVSVICPRPDGAPRHQTLDGVSIYGFRAVAASGGPVSYLVEFANGLVWTGVLSLWLLVRERFDVVQTCNPPDTMFVLGWLWRCLGIPLVYDQHDLCPEVFLSRFPQQCRRRDTLLRILWLLERRTYRCAKHVIVTNESYRAIARERGGLPDSHITTVMSTPDPDRMRRQAKHPELRANHDRLACYLGIMGPQDGVNLLLDAIAHYVHTMGRTDCHFALLGSGDCYEELRRQAVELDLTDHVHFTGFADDSTIAAYLSTADVGLSPDPFSAFNDVSTMNKTLEYMAFGVPVVAFDLTETRRSAAGAAEYVAPNDVLAYARAIAALVDNDERRLTMGRIGRLRIERLLSWQHQARAYVGVFDAILSRGRAAPRDVTAPEVIVLDEVPAQPTPVAAAHLSEYAETVRDPAHARA